MPHVEAYDIVPEELRALKRRWPGTFLGLPWPRYAVTIRTGLTDEHAQELVTHWALQFRAYDQGIAWEGQPVDERREAQMNQRLSYWSDVWDESKVRLIHDRCYAGFRHPTEEQCREAEARAARMRRVFGSLPN